ncbi:unnamed protein product [Arctogadus glacialis]
MPLGLSAVVLVVIQSMATRKRIGEMMHPCLTPDCTENHSESQCRLVSSCFGVGAQRRAPRTRSKKNPAKLCGNSCEMEIPFTKWNLPWVPGGRGCFQYYVQVNVIENDSITR